MGNIQNKLLTADWLETLRGQNVKLVSFRGVYKDGDVVDYQRMVGIYCDTERYVNSIPFHSGSQLKSNNRATAQCREIDGGQVTITVKDVKYTPQTTKSPGMFWGEYVSHYPGYTLTSTDDVDYTITCPLYYYEGQHTGSYASIGRLNSSGT